MHVSSGYSPQVEQTMPLGTVSGGLQKRRSRGVPETGKLAILGDWVSLLFAE